MPRGDGSGPNGFGPMSGRGLGYCAGYDRPGFAQPGPGMGQGRGYGMGRGGRGGGGRGWRNMYWATGQPGWMRTPGYVAPAMNPVSEQEALRHQAQALQSELEQVQTRLASLEESNSAGDK